MAATFEAAVRHEPGIAIIDLAGDITGDSESKLIDAYQAVAINDVSTILLTFDNVGYINSAGIAVLVGLLARARREQRILTACGVSDHFCRIFELIRLTDFIALFPDETAARANALAITNRSSPVDARLGSGQISN